MATPEVADPARQGGVRRVDVGAESDLAEDTILPAQVDGTDIIVLRSSAGLRAYQGTCTHEYYQLSEGILDGTGLTCAMHLSRFDLVTGAVLEGPAGIPLVSYPVELREGRLMLLLPEGEIPVNE